MWHKNKHQHGLLFIAYIIVALSVISCNPDSRNDDFVNNVSYYADQSCKELIFTYEHNIEILNKYIKSDSIELITKNDFYSSMRSYGEASIASFHFFTLLTSLYTNDKNKLEVRKIGDDYRDKLIKLNEFYIFHHDYNDFQIGDIDTLYSFYNSLASKIKQLRKIKIEQ